MVKKRVGAATLPKATRLLAGLLITSAPPAFRRDGRQAFEKATQIVRQDQRALPVLHGAKFTAANRLIEVGAPNAGSLARLKNTVRELGHGISPPLTAIMRQRHRTSANVVTALANKDLRTHNNLLRAL
jgi:hypothetical protein